MKYPMQVLKMAQEIGYKKEFSLPLAIIISEANETNMGMVEKMLYEQDFLSENDDFEKEKQIIKQEFENKRELLLEKLNKRISEIAKQIAKQMKYGIKTNATIRLLILCFKISKFKRITNIKPPRENMKNININMAF